MARRGSFGRVPRYAVSLTSTIIAIAREMQNQRDSNLLDAWKSGGMFEGKPVSDSMVLAHWKGRMSDVSKDDPMYDTYQNAYMQYDYAISESRMSTRYAKGEIGDAAMGQFYINWSKKVPKDSEFYRTLQRDGAQFMRSAKAKGEAAAKKAAEERYQNQLKGMHDKDQVSGEYLLEVVSRMAGGGSADSGIQPLIGGAGSGQGLDNFDPSDPEQMLRLISLISPGGVASTGTLFHDEDGKPVTGVDIVAKLKTLDPKFNGNVTSAYVSAQVKRQRDSIGEQEALATQTGHSGDAETLNKRKGGVTELGREINAWPVQSDYMDAYAEYNAALSNTFMSPAALIGAWKKYQGELVKLADDPRIAGDDNTRARLLGEANQVDGQPTLAESFTGLQNGEPTANSNIAYNKRWLDDSARQVDEVAAGTSMWTQGVYGKDGVFTPQPGGPSIGSATNEEIKALSPSGKAEIVYVPSGDGKTMTPVATVATEITVVATDPRTGKPVSFTKDAPVGTVRIVYVNGKPIEEYGFTASDGITRYTTSPFWGEGVGVRRTAGGIELDVSSSIPPDTTPLAGGAVSPGWSIGGKTSPGVNPTTGEKLAGNPGTYVMDPLLAITATAPDRWRAGADPMTDFTSPSIPLLLDSRVPEGGRNLRQLSQDTSPGGFMDRINSEAYVAAGFTFDQKAGWVGGDPLKYAQITGHNQIGLRAEEYTSVGEGDYAQRAGLLWDRTTTNPTVQGTATWRTAIPGREVSGLSGGLVGGGGKLPLDQLRGTPFEALGKTTIDGTNLLAPSVSAATGFTLKTGKALTVPSVAPTPAPGPTPTSGIQPTAIPGLSAVPGSSNLGGAIPGLSGAAAARAEKARRDRYL